MSKTAGIFIGAGGAIAAMAIGAGAFAAYDRMGDDETAVATPTTSTTEASTTTTGATSTTSTTEAVASSPDAYVHIDADQLREEEARGYERGREMAMEMLDELDEDEDERVSQIVDRIMSGGAGPSPAEIDLLYEYKSEHPDFIMPEYRPPDFEPRVVVAPPVVVSPPVLREIPRQPPIITPPPPRSDIEDELAGIEHHLCELTTTAYRPVPLP